MFQKNFHYLIFQRGDQQAHLQNILKTSTIIIEFGVSDDCNTQKLALIIFT